MTCRSACEGLLCRERALRVAAGRAQPPEGYALSARVSFLSPSPETDVSFEASNGDR